MTPDKPFEEALAELLAAYEADDTKTLDEIVSALEVHAMALRENPSDWEKG